MQTSYRFLIIVGLIIFCNNLIAQPLECVGLSITQNILPDGLSYTYKYKNSKLRIYKEYKWNKSRRIFSKHLKREQKDSVDNYICMLVGKDFLSNYSEPVLDGINWYFELICGEDSTEIYFDNATIVEFEDFLDFLNGLIPKKKRFITMRHAFAVRQE